MFIKRKTKAVSLAVILLVLLSVLSSLPLSAANTNLHPGLSTRGDLIWAALDSAFDAKADELEVEASEYLANDTVLKDEAGNDIDMDAYIDKLFLDAAYLRAYTAHGYLLAIVDDLYEKNYVGTYTSMADLADEIADFFPTAFYLDKLTDTEMVTDAVIYAYMRMVGDTYASYYNEETFAEYEADNAAEYSGIGVTVTLLDDGYAEVLGVTPDSPAAKAGVLPGDIITAVNGEDFATIGYSAAINLIRGETGTTVDITFKRGESYNTYTLTREKLTEYTVEYRMLSAADGKIGYIRISQFDEGTFGQFKNAYESLGKSGAEKYIFDVRNNPGGRLDSVLAVLEYILPDDTDLPLLHMQYKDETVTYRSLFDYIDGNDTLEKLYKDAKNHEIKAPIAVLCNEFTASAGELFTSCLMDFGVATSFGTKTYGKGTGQSGFYMTDYYAYEGLNTTLFREAIVNISTFRYHTAKTSNYEGVGITPNVITELSEEAAALNFYKLTEEIDNQLLAAVSFLNQQEGVPYQEKVPFFKSDAFFWTLFGILAFAAVSLTAFFVWVLTRRRKETDLFAPPTDTTVIGSDDGTNQN